MFRQMNCVYLKDDAVIRSEIKMVLYNFTIYHINVLLQNITLLNVNIDLNGCPLYIIYIHLSP